MALSKKVPWADFVKFDQEIMVWLLGDTSVRYGQSFFDRFSYMYVEVNKEPWGEIMLQMVYWEPDPDRAKRMVMPYVESPPEGYNEDSETTI